MTASPVDAVSSILFGGSAVIAMYCRQREQESRNQKKAPPKGSKSLDLVRYLSDDSSHNNAWESYTDDEELFVQKFPKIELHVHVSCLCSLSFPKEKRLSYSDFSFGFHSFSWMAVLILIFSTVT